MANENGQDPNAQQHVIGQVHGGRLFEDDVEDYSEDWGEVYGGNREQQVPDDGGQSQGNTDVAELRGQLSQMQKTIEQLQQQNMALMQQPAQAPQQQDQGGASQPQEEELPDPFDNPKEYAAAVERNIRKRMDAEREQERQQQQSQQSEQQKYQELWHDFTIKHKDYADDPEKVQFAANKVAQKASKRGLDLNRYMFTHRDQFMQDVTEEMDRIFGAKQQQSQQQTPQFVPDQQAPAHDPGRTQGMFGGQAQGNRPAAGEVEESTDPFSDIREFQKKTGFHR